VGGGFRIGVEDGGTTGLATGLGSGRLNRFIIIFFMFIIFLLIPNCFRMFIKNVFMT
jgi:hypothetical protein